MEHGNVNRDRVVLFVPGQVCVTVSSAAKPEEFYFERVPRGLDREFRRALDRLRRADLDGKRDSIDEDLAPLRYWRPILDDPDKLRWFDIRPLGGADNTRGEDDVPRWVVIPPAEEEAAPAATTLCFYGFGETTLGRGDHAHHVLAERTSRLVKLLAWERLRQGAEEGEGGAERIVTVTPNWLSSATQLSCPSPGAKPKPVPTVPGPGRWTFEFANDELSYLVEGQRAREDPADVVVAILDTSPTRADVIERADACPDNLLLRAVADSPRVRIDEDPGLSIPRDAFTYLDGYLPNWRDAIDGADPDFTSPTYRLEDHGLFAAGIVHDIAPRCAVHLIRVLGGYGVSDMRTVTPVLLALPGKLLKDPTQRLVVNMSLGFAIPPGVQILREWLEATFADLADEIAGYDDLQAALEGLAKEHPTTIAAVQQFLTDLMSTMDIVVRWLEAHPNVLIVAAAGNDNDYFPKFPDRGSLPRRPEPRWPARYDRVFGVAAGAGPGGRADFSNRGDVRLMGNGVATFGGEARPGPLGELGEIDTNTSPVDAVKGIYSGEELVFKGGANETGWVYWAGTSFSTPVISAIAADYWSAQRPEERSTAEEVIRAVMRFAVDPHDGHDPDRLDCPTIEARQYYTVR